MLLVSCTPSFEKLSEEQCHFHQKSYGIKRNEIMKELRCLGGWTDVIGTINTDTLYKIVSPEGAILQFNPANGTYNAVLRDNGKIVTHPQFAKIGVNAFNVAKAIGTQILLISIAMQLNEIQRAVEKLSRDMHYDRIAEIQTGMELFKDATLSSNEFDRRMRINNAIQTLSSGLNKTISELKNRISEAPAAEDSIFDHINPFTNKIEQAEKAMDIAAESFHAVINGLAVLCQCYAETDDYDIVHNRLPDYINKIKRCGIEEAAKKSRLLECAGNSRPQEPWLDFINNSSKFEQDLMLLRGDRVNFAIEIEFMGHEIIGG